MWRWSNLGNGATLKRRSSTITWSRTLLMTTSDIQPTPTSCSLQVSPSLLLPSSSIITTTTNHHHPPQHWQHLNSQFHRAIGSTCAVLGASEVHSQAQSSARREWQHHPHENEDGQRPHGRSWPLQVPSRECVRVITPLYSPISLSFVNTFIQVCFPVADCLRGQGTRRINTGASLFILYHSEFYFSC